MDAKEEAQEVLSHYTEDWNALSKKEKAMLLQHGDGYVWNCLTFKQKRVVSQELGFWRTVFLVNAVTEKKGFLAPMIAAYILHTGLKGVGILILIIGLFIGILMIAGAR